MSLSFRPSWDIRALEEVDNSTSLHDYVVFIVVCFFSIFFTLCGSFLAYYSWREYILMQEYLHQGTVLDGYIVTQEYLRDIPDLGVMDTEYSATCEYEHQVDHQPTIRVRKQVRVRGSDLFHKPIHYAKLLRTKVVMEKNNTSAAVQLLLLPGFPLSGYPCRAVQRAITIQHQISTMALIVALLGISFFCVFTFAGFIQDMIHVQEDSTVWLSLGLISFMAFVELAMIHFFFRAKIETALSQEYKISAEYDFPYEQ
jgi:hypothetical protein